MTKSQNRYGILGIHPNWRGVSFVFLEDGVLLDWGTRGRDRDVGAVFKELLGRFRPDIVVLEDADSGRCERRPRMRHLLRRMARCANKRGITVRKVSRNAVRRSWAERGQKNKHRVALKIGANFPEIAPYVPRHKKAWESEDPKNGIFDAISLVLHGSEVGGGKETLGAA